MPNERRGADGKTPSHRKKIEERKKKAIAKSEAIAEERKKFGSIVLAAENLERNGKKVEKERKEAEKAELFHIREETGRLLLRLNDLLGELSLKWTPHDFQIDMICSVIAERKRIVGAETGRQIGKSEGIIALAGIWGQLVPSSQSHYMAPFLKQARKILWDNGRIRAVLPENWIDDFKEKNSTVYFSGSKDCFMTVDGADKFDATRGMSVNRGILFLDECREMRAGLWDVIKPALGVHGCPAVFTSSPPDDLYPYPDDPKRLHWFCELIDEIKGLPDCKALFAKTADNPHFPKDFIERERIEYERRGRSFIFCREYLGERVEGKVSREWPMLVDRDRFVKPHEEVVREIERDASKMQWFCMTDPAGSSVWAWSFIGFNPYTRHIYMMDEIYETKKEFMATGVMWPLAKQKILEIYPDEPRWSKHYDEAETWFQNEIFSNYGVSFQPSYKTSKSKDEGFRLLSDIFLANKITFSDRCEHAFWELKNYEGHRSSDHQVDNLRYFLNVSNYSLPDRPENNRVYSEAELRYQRLTGQIKQGREEIVDDWTRKVLLVQ